jgi:copper(I)-binding protein
MTKTSLKLFAATLALASGPLFAQAINVQDAWVRTTVQGQKGTGGFMKITAKDGARLIGVSTPVAGVAEVHEMKMEGDVMRMRAVPVLDLPAGTTVELKPGGYHLMLQDLKTTLPKDTTVPMTLTFEDAKGVRSTLALKVPVAVNAPGSASGGAAGSAPAAAHKH